MNFHAYVAGVFWAFFSKLASSKYCQKNAENELSRGLKEQESEEHLALLCELGEKIVLSMPFSLTFYILGLREEYLFCFIFNSIAAFLLIVTFFLSLYLSLLPFLVHCFWLLRSCFLRWGLYFYALWLHRHDDCHLR